MGKCRANMMEMPQEFTAGRFRRYLRRPALPITMATLIFMMSVACAPASGAAIDPIATTTGTLTVFAAVSLSEAFSEIATEFESANPAVSVDLNLVGSQRLRTQLEHGARGDVFASADQRQMSLAAANGILEGKPVVFATNQLAVIVPNDDSFGRVIQVNDLGKQGIKLALALPDVPAGGYAREMISKLESLETAPDAHLGSKIMANVVTLEPSVRGVAAKVALGEVDAGVVYVTDVSTGYIRDRVRVISIPDGSNVVAAYPIAALREARDPSSAENFIRFVLSSKGQSILRSHGFGPAANP